MRSRNSGCLGIVVLFFVFLFGINFVSGIRINEIELNPPGEDSKNEWVELYSESEINLSGYSIKNNGGKDVNLSGIFSGYYVYIFEKRWLINSDEKVYLYFNGGLIDSSEVVKDDKDNNSTWAYCSGWVFAEGTKGTENNCEDDEPDETPPDDNQSNEDVNETIADDAGEGDENDDGSEVESNEGGKSAGVSAEDEEKKTDKKQEVIYLEPFGPEPKNIKTDENNKVLFRSTNDTIKHYAIYGFAAFCVVIIVLLLIERKNG